MADERREKLQRMGAKWLERIVSAEKREEEWRRDAEAAEKAYINGGGELEGKVYDFNILHSNVETIVPAIYNSTPVPDIRRRFADDDPVAKQTGQLIERAIAVLIDDNRLDREIEAGARDAFLSGRDIVRLRFDATWVDLTGDDGEPLVDDSGDPMQAPQDERILFEAVSWRDFRFGPAKRWEDVNWIAFRHSIPREEIERLSDPELLDAQRGADEITLRQDSEDDIVVWEVWCRETRTVKFIRDSDRKVLKVMDDPLGLDGFYPIPEPVQPITLTGRLVPVCPFSIYRRLADELDTIEKRILKITSTMKHKAMTFGEAGDMEEFAAADDGEIVVARNLEQMAQTKGIDGALAWWPIEPAAKALAQLYLNREQTKQAIYEITGISDIVRGASNANETLGAQQIKTQWGSLRIQKMQRMVERQVRDVFVLMAEIIAKHFSPETLTRMTGIQVTPEIMALLQDGPARNYRIDVESDSTVRADLTRMRGEMGEFLTGTANFFGAIGPVVQEKPEIQGPMVEVYTSFARQFRLGKQAEDALDQLGQMAKQPQPEQPDPEQMKMQAEAERAQGEMQLRAQAEQMKAQHEQARLQFEGEKAAAEHQLKVREQSFNEWAEGERIKIEWVKVGQGDTDRALKATDSVRQDSREREKMASAERQSGEKIKAAERQRKEKA